MRSKSNYILINSFKPLTIVFTTNEARKLAYEVYQYFFKSVIYYALDMEKIMCLMCLKSFCQCIEVKNKVFEDVKLIEYLESLIKNCGLFENDDLKKRLNNVIKDFLLFKK